MILDDEYTFIYVCPETDEQVMHDDCYNNGGVCKRCGHIEMIGKEQSNIAHHKSVAGRWSRPTWWERVWHKKKAEFFRKEDEDEVMDALKRDYNED